MPMKRNLTLLTTTLMLGLGGCATTSNSPQNLTEAQSANSRTQASMTGDEIKTSREVADKLTQSRTTTKSADGKMICKRQAIAGSNFKRKICGSPEHWENLARDSHPQVDRIQRAKAGTHGS